MCSSDNWLFFQELLNARDELCAVMWEVYNKADQADKIRMAQHLFGREWNTRNVSSDEAHA